MRSFMIRKTNWRAIYRSVLLWPYYRHSTSNCDLFIIHHSSLLLIVMMIHTFRSFNTVFGCYMMIHLFPAGKTVRISLLLSNLVSCSNHVPRKLVRTRLSANKWIYKGWTSTYTQTIFLYSCFCIILFSLSHAGSGTSIFQAVFLIADQVLRFSDITSWSVLSGLNGRYQDGSDGSLAGSYNSQRPSNSIRLGWQASAPILTLLEVSGQYLQS